MKRFSYFFIFLLAISGLSAQNSNLVFFSEQGEQFLLVLNGVQQNNDAQTNVKVTDIIGNTVKVKIMFANDAIPQIDKAIYYNPGMETTYSIKKNNKGEYVLRPFSEAPIAQVVTPVPNQEVIVYGTPSVKTQTVVTQPVATQTTVTQTTVTQPVNGEGVSMGISINDPMGGTNINMNVNAGTTGTSSATTYSETTTTSTTVGYTEEVYDQPRQPEHYVMQGYNGPVGCPWPMDQGAFMQAKSSIQAKSFDDSKLIIAKQVLASNCMLCSQVKELMMLFSFEDSRLDFAKFAYGHTYDIGNFYMVNDAFDFESTIDELNNYINGYHW
ncbi:MAG: hypothetical protein CVU11_05310 [Bacteroidetes bacterium HGW-Bacteroidetes-6]|jgi:hypothetical protein|nr:MAG: hypothetical protein CVU11_05310 [Bacteroidetes bacterium HGW-Bacteroidetes-6]